MVLRKTVYATAADVSLQKNTVKCVVK